MEVLDGGDWLFHGSTVSILNAWIFLYRSISSMTCEPMFADGVGMTTNMVASDNGRLIQRCTEILLRFSEKPMKGHSHCISQMHLIWRPATICHMGRLQWSGIERSFQLG
jgi:hypothetical protein